MPQKDTRIALIGPGAIGTTIAAALHEVGQPVTLCGRTAHERLTLRFDGGEVVLPGPVCVDPAAVKGTFDLVFVAVKSTQIDAAAPWLSALCDAHTVVCVLQNGVEQVDHFTRYLSGATVLPAIVWFPAQREKNGAVWLRGTPRLTLPDTPPAQLVEAALRDTRCAVELSANFTSLAWRKLLQNAAGGLMVLTGRRMGMFARADITALARGYLQECLCVARAEGATLHDEVVQEIIGGFRAAPPDMGTSILADRQGDRPLEWDCRNGVVQRFGLRHGIATPISDLIVPLLAAASDGPG